jgi:hypothetical protein
MAWLRRTLGASAGAILVAAIAPAAVFVLFATRGWLNVDHLVMLGGLAIVSFAPSYVFADFLLSLFSHGGAEEDAPRPAR